MSDTSIKRQNQKNINRLQILPLVIVKTMIKNPIGISFLVFLLILLTALPRIIGEYHPFTHTYIHQAISFLNGWTHIEAPLEEVVEMNGRRFSVFPPFPAILLMPIVFFFGTATKTLTITPILGAITAYYSFHLALKNGVSEDVAGWVTLGFLCGTSFFVCATFPVDTYLAHLCAVMFVIIALHEAFGRQRGLVIGFALGFAILSRQLTILTVPFVWAVLFLGNSEDGRAVVTRRQIFLTFIGLGCCALMYGLFNWVRFGNPLESGYNIRSLVEPGWYGYRAQNWGNFHWVYIPSNLIRMFLSGFDINFDDPGLMLPSMAGFGSSLTFASPVIFYAFAGRITQARGLTAAAWICIGLTTIAVLAHKSALGGYQVNGVRYTLDFMPVLFLLTALGMERVKDTALAGVAKGLIIYAILLNLLAIVGIFVIRELLLKLPH